MMPLTEIASVIMQAIAYFIPYVQYKGETQAIYADEDIYCTFSRQNVYLLYE